MGPIYEFPEVLRPEWGKHLPVGSEDLQLIVVGKASGANQPNFVWSRIDFSKDQKVPGDRSN
jgi:hypothetical protein